MAILKVHQPVVSAPSLKHFLPGSRKWHGRNKVLTLAKTTSASNNLSDSATHKLIIIYQLNFWINIHNVCWWQKILSEIVWNYQKQADFLSETKHQKLDSWQKNWFVYSRFYFVHYFWQNSITLLIIKGWEKVCESMFPLLLFKISVPKSMMLFVLTKISSITNTVFSGV